MQAEVPLNYAMSFGRSWFFLASVMSGVANEETDAFPRMCHNQISHKMFCLCLARDFGLTLQLEVLHSLQGVMLHPQCLRTASCLWICSPLDVLFLSRAGFRVDPATRGRQHRVRDQLHVRRADSRGPITAQHDALWHMRTTSRLLHQWRALPRHVSHVTYSCARAERIFPSALHFPDKPTK